MFNKKSVKLDIAQVIVKQNDAIVNELKELNKALSGGSIGNIKLQNGFSISSNIDSVSSHITSLETNVYTKQQTVDVVNKEILYNEDYKKRYNENKYLLELIETYCRYKDKYEVIEIFDKIKSKYKVEEKKLNSK